MKKILIAFIVMISSISLSAQDAVEDQIKVLYDKDDYKTIVNEYASKKIDYSANSLYYIGVAYMMQEDDDNCIKYMDLSIAKDSANPAPYYTKATSLLYTYKPDESIPIFQKAISLDSDNEKLAQSYTGLGFAYFQLQKYDLALDSYNKAIQHDKKISIPYIMKAQIYTDLNQKDNALKAYYDGQQNASKETDEYITILFNIGLMEHLKGNYREAETAYNELISLNPNDFHTYAKLIQIHYHFKEYDKATSLKEKLYDAHNKGILNEDLSDMFCIDQFEFKDKLVQVHERYEEGKSSKIYNKLLFYILDKNNNIEFRIQTEYSPIAVAMGEAKYILCANKDDMHINYGIGFNDESSYDSIKNAVISILEKEQ